MAAFNNGQWIGDRAIRPTDEQLLRLQRMDHAFGDVGVALFWRSAGYFPIHFTVHTDPGNTTKSSLEYKARFPFKVVHVQYGCESAAGSAATADLQKNPAGSPDTWATMTTGANDIKTAAGEFVEGEILDGSEDVAYGDQLRLTVVGTGAGAVVGAQAIAHCFRL